MTITFTVLLLQININIINNNQMDENRRRRSMEKFILREAFADGESLLFLGSVLVHSFPPPLSYFQDIFRMKFYGDKRSSSPMAWDISGSTRYANMRHRM